MEVKTPAESRSPDEAAANRTPPEAAVACVSACRFRRNPSHQSGESASAWAARAGQIPSRRAKAKRIRSAVSKPLDALTGPREPDNDTVSVQRFARDKPVGLGEDVGRSSDVESPNTLINDNRDDSWVYVLVAII